MDKNNLKRRLKKMDGLVNAIDKMIGDDGEDVLVQINAVKSALHRPYRSISALLYASFGSSLRILKALNVVIRPAARTYSIVM